MQVFESNLQALKYLHAAESYSHTLLSLDILAADVEWWAAGAHQTLPWAGTFRGPGGVAQFFERLNAIMDYTSFSAREYLVSGDQVAVIISAGGKAKPTGKLFESQIVRIYSFRGPKIARVRNYYDTAAYEASLRED